MRLRPTPRRSARRSTLTSRRWSPGPIPERISKTGEKIAPAQRMTSRARKSLASPSTRGSDAGYAASVKKEMRYIGRRRDGKVCAPPNAGVEIAHCGRRAPGRRIAHRQRAVAVPEVGIHVGNERKLAHLCIFMSPPRERSPILPIDTADWDRPGVPMRLACKIEVGFELPEEGQDVLPTPSECAKSPPLVVVVGGAAQGDHPHDARAATDDARLVECGRGRIVLGAPMGLQRRPHIALVVIGRRIDIEDVRWLSPGRRICAGLQEKNRNVRAGGEAVGDHAAG